MQLDLGRHSDKIPFISFSICHSKFQASIVDKMYEKCAVSVFGNFKILLLNGGVGTGKTSFICQLLFRFANENFQITNSILVCCRNNALCDAIAAKMMAKIKNSNEKEISNRDIVNQLPDYFGKFDLCFRAFLHFPETMVKFCFRFFTTARFGTLAAMRHGVRGIGVEIFNPKLAAVKVVFTTLHNAVDLLQ